MEVSWERNADLSASGVSLLLMPYSVSPWVLSGAPAFYWMIGAAEMWRVFAAPSFSTFFARRVRDGFRLPHCMGCCKAIHYATRLCCGCRAVKIFDVVEVPLEGGVAILRRG
ncbi:hypothetical protein C3747_151g57 [Trypanosoma cruzi]|uniref:Uncharacterized protein n=1 Tax=Trypanosoma cruzi TaxID=5693 RepID=A0A2V2W705_TRYCR|nr:hypothetical protein C3747_151g57 [Trypanosoma cruzi]RNC38064.1 hypothetical protein TcCL_NonESM12731 [Trypanosoma cruzi]